MNFTSNKTINKIIKYMLAFVGSILVCVYINWRGGGYTEDESINIFSYTILAPVLYLFVLMLVNKYLLLKERNKRYCYYISLLFSAVFIAGASLAYRGYAAENFGELILLAFCSFVLAFPVAGGFGTIASYLYNYNLNREFLKINMTDKKFFIISMAVILLCWFPVFLAFFPSVFTYDCDAQLMYYFEDNMNNHHPIIHTLMLALFYNIGDWIFSSPNIGIMFYSITQELIMSAIFAYVTTYMYRKKVPSFILILSMIFYAVIPINSILALSATKDVIFSGLVLLTTVLWFDFKDKDISKLKIILYGVLWVVMILFRNNAVYALVITAIVFLVLKIDVVFKKKAVIFFASVFVGYFVVDAALMSATDAGEIRFVHSCSVPLQQISRVISLKYDEMSQEQKDNLFEYVPEDVGDKYIGVWADPIKNIAHNSNMDEDKVGFFSEWFKLGLDYPGIYIDAFLDLNRGNIFLDDVSHSKVYMDSPQDTRIGYLMTKFRPYGETEENSLFESLRDEMIYYFSDNHYQEIPIISIIFSPALYTWLLIIYCVVIFYIKKRNLIFPIIFTLAYFFTVTLGPVCLVRYVYFIIISVPLLGAILFKELQNDEISKIISDSNKVKKHITENNKGLKNNKRKTKRK